MEREIIEAMVHSLPISEMGVAAEDHEIWEETDGDAYFTVTRHWLTVPNTEIKYEVVALTVSGPPNERRRIVREFTDIFGAASQREEYVGGHIEPDTILWVVN